MSEVRYMISDAAKLVDGNTDDWASTAVSEEADAEETDTGRTEAG